MQKVNKVMLALSIIGLLISIYLAAYHYIGGVPLICQNSGLINCANVLNSQYAILLGIPIALYGVVFFIAELLLLQYKKDNVTLIWNLLGLGFVIYFVYAEYMVGNICEYCTAVHVITIALLALSIYKFLKS